MHHDIHSNRSLMQTACVAASFHDWLCTEGEELIDAAELLGGDPWRGRAEDLVQAVVDGEPVGDLHDEIAALHDLLTLDPMDDPFCCEALRFMEIDPDDPRATGAMLCAEALERGLNALDRLSAVQVREAA